MDELIYFIVSLLFIAVVGRMGSTVMFKPLFNFFDRALERMPVIKTIYSPVKDMMGAFVGNKKKFTKPVLVTTNVQTGIQQIGFMTHSDLHALGIPTSKVAVYMPHSYAISGILMIVPAENVTALDIPAAEAMKFIVSGGVVTDLD